MSAGHTPAIGDMYAVTKIHGDFTDRVNDLAMAMQDATYQLGRQRGLLDGKAQRDDLLAALREAREALQMANDTPGSPITDTIWMMHRPETLFDFIDAAIAKATGGAT